MKNIQGIENSPVMKLLDQFSGMVARSFVIKVQNPDDASDERTERDYGDRDLMEKADNE